MATQSGPAKQAPDYGAHAGALTAWEHLINLCSRYPYLSRKEERETARRMESGDKAAQDKLILHNLGLVVCITRKYPWGHLGLEDLVQEGIIGLVIAASRFDPERGVRFSSYAGWWIRAKIRQALNAQERLIRDTAHVRDAVRRAKDESTRAAALGGKITAEEALRRTGADEKTIRRIVQSAALSGRPESLDSPRHKDGEGEDISPLYAFIAADGPSLEDGHEFQLKLGQVAEALAELPPLERFVLTDWYLQGFNLTEVGRGLRLSRERPRQITKRAIARLQRILKRAKPARPWSVPEFCDRLLSLRRAAEPLARAGGRRISQRLEQWRATGKPASCKGRPAVRVRQEDGVALGISGDSLKIMKSHRWIVPGRKRNEWLIRISAKQAADWYARRHHQALLRHKRKRRQRRKK